MAFAAPDPKRVEADRQRLRQRELDDIAAIEREKRIKQEIRSCYHVDEGGYSPPQIAQAGKMIAAGRIHDTLESLSEGTKAEWRRIGRSRGGRRKGNLYVCNRAFERVPS